MRENGIHLGEGEVGELLMPSQLTGETIPQAVLATVMQGREVLLLANPAALPGGGKYCSE